MKATIIVVIIHVVIMTIYYICKGAIIPERYRNFLKGGRQILGYLQGLC